MIMLKSVLEATRYRTLSLPCFVILPTRLKILGLILVKQDLFGVNQFERLF